MRFTLKTLLTATSVAAVLCCIFFTLPAVLAIFLLGAMWLFAPPALVAGIVYGRGYGRAFSIGCTTAGGCLPLLWLYGSFGFVSVLGDMSSLTIDNETAATAKIAFGASFFVIGMSGLVSMTVRWLSLRMATDQPVTAPAPSPSPAEYSVLRRRVTTLPANRRRSADDEPEATDEEY